MIDRWIKTYEKLLKWEWYGDPLMVATLIHLLLKANWKDKKWRGVDVKRGQLITSRTRLAEEIGLTERQLRTCLERMQETGEIACETTNRYTIITICNYDIYQDKTEAQRPAERPAESQTNDQQTTNKRPTGSQQTTTPIEYIESIEGQDPKNIYNPLPHARAREIGIEAFGSFSNVFLYPGEHRALVETYGQVPTDKAVDDLSCKIAEGDDQAINSRNHYATLDRWLRYQRETGKVNMTSTAADPFAEREKDLRIVWKATSEKGKQEYLDTHEGLLPWDYERKHKQQ